MELLDTFGIYSLVGLLCLAGFMLSCISFSGTWLVWLATGLASWHRWPAFPHIKTLIFFLLLCIFVEVAENFSTIWGVERAKGSKAAGWGAMGGGFLGMFLGGALLPIPVIGNLLGIMLGSFLGAFGVEYKKIKQTNHALKVAKGAMLARILVLVFKVEITLFMILVLALGLIF